MSAAKVPVAKGTKVPAGAGLAGRGRGRGRGLTPEMLSNSANLMSAPTPTVEAQLPRFGSTLSVKTISGGGTPAARAFDPGWSIGSKGMLPPPASLPSSSQVSPSLLPARNPSFGNASGIKAPSAAGSSALLLRPARSSTQRSESQGQKLVREHTEKARRASLGVDDNTITVDTDAIITSRGTHLGHDMRLRDGAWEDDAALGRFVNRRLTHVNGIEVNSMEEVVQAAKNAAVMALQFAELRKSASATPRLSVTSSPALMGIMPGLLANDMRPRSVTLEVGPKDPRTHEPWGDTKALRLTLAAAKKKLSEADAFDAIMQELMQGLDALDGNATATDRTPVFVAAHYSLTDEFGKGVPFADVIDGRAYTLRDDAPHPPLAQGGGRPDGSMQRGASSVPSVEWARTDDESHPGAAASSTVTPAPSRARETPSPTPSTQRSRSRLADIISQYDDADNGNDDTLPSPVPRDVVADTPATTPVDDGRAADAADGAGDKTSEEEEGGEGGVAPVDSMSGSDADREIATTLPQPGDGLLTLPVGVVPSEESNDAASRGDGVCASEEEAIEEKFSEVVAAPSEPLPGVKRVPSMRDDDARAPAETVEDAADEMFRSASGAGSGDDADAAPASPAETTADHLSRGSDDKSSVTAQPLHQPPPEFSPCEDPLATPLDVPVSEPDFHPALKTTEPSHTLPAARSGSAKREPAVLTVPSVATPSVRTPQAAAARPGKKRRAKDVVHEAPAAGEAVDEAALWEDFRVRLQDEGCRVEELYACTTNEILLLCEVQLGFTQLQAERITKVWACERCKVRGTPHATAPHTVSTAAAASPTTLSARQAELCGSRELIDPTTEHFAQVESVVLSTIVCKSVTSAEILRIRQLIPSANVCGRYNAAREALNAESRTKKMLYYAGPSLPPLTEITKEALYSEAARVGGLVFSTEAHIVGPSARASTTKQLLLCEVLVGEVARPQDPLPGTAAGQPPPPAALADALQAERNHARRTGAPMVHTLMVDYPYAMDSPNEDVQVATQYITADAARVLPRYVVYIKVRNSKGGDQQHTDATDASSRRGRDTTAVSHGGRDHTPGGGRMSRKGSTSRPRKRSTSRRQGSTRDAGLRGRHDPRAPPSRAALEQQLAGALAQKSALYDAVCDAPRQAAHARQELSEAFRGLHRALEAKEAALQRQLQGMLERADAQRQEHLEQLTRVIRETTECIEAGTHTEAPAGIPPCAAPPTMRVDVDDILVGIDAIAYPPYGALEP